MATTHYILAGWLIDGSGGPVREKVLLAISDGRFTAVGPYEEGQLPTGASLTDLSHCTIMPPLVDSHVHLFMSGTIDRQARERQLVADYDELRPIIARHLRDLFSHGVLAIRDGGDRGGFASRYCAEEKVPAAMRIKTAGQAWYCQSRYGGLIGRNPGQGESLAEAYAGGDGQADVVKLVNSGLNSLRVFGRETAPQFDRDEIAALVQLANRQGRKVMVHANGQEPVRNAIEGGCHSIEHGYFMGRDNLARMAELGIFWVPTVFTMKAYALNFAHAEPQANLQVVQKNLEHQLGQLALARQLGVKVALGTDAGSLGVLHGESVVEEMKLMIKAGYPLTETIAAATSRGAELLGLPQIGLIAKNKEATFLVTRGLPSQLPRKLTYLEGMYINGLPSQDYRKNPVKHLGVRPQMT